MLIQRAQLENAINKCRAADTRDAVSAADLSRMAEVYGRMIWAREREIETDKLDTDTAHVIKAWIEA